MRNRKIVVCVFLLLGFINGFCQDRETVSIENVLIKSNHYTKITGVLRNSTKYPVYVKIGIEKFSDEKWNRYAENIFERLDRKSTPILFLGVKERRTFYYTPFGVDVDEKHNSARICKITIHGKFRFVFNWRVSQGNFWDNVAYSESFLID